MTETIEELRKRNRDRMRKRRADNPDYDVEYRKSHRAENSERARSWKAANPERARENVRRWREANPEKARELDRRGAARTRAKIKNTMIIVRPDL